MKHLTSIIIVLFLFATSFIKANAQFTVHLDKKEAPATAYLEIETKGYDTYTWDFGDGTTGKEGDTQHRYTHAGNYTITLTTVKGKKTKTMTQSISIDPPAKCLVEISTEYGVMTAELYDATPQHRDNFMKLVEEGFYNGLLFHRVIDGFMIQGGDPNSLNAAPGAPLGSGGPGYTVPAEFVDSLIHVKGAIAAARTGDAVNPEKRSSGSQFYIVQGNVLDENAIKMWEQRHGFEYTEEQRQQYMTLGGIPSLDRGYTVFGHVISGLDVIDKIAKVQTDGRNRPNTDVKMNIRVIR